MPYPSDLSEEQWSIIEPLIPATKARGVKRKYAKREMMNAIFYLNKTGCHWRYLPSDFPPWGNVYHFFQNLTDRGVFEKINTALRKEIRTRDNRDKDPSLICIDSQSIKGDVNLQESGIDGNKKIKGRKRHIAVDVLGLIVLCAVTAANTADIHPARDFIKQLSHQPRLEKVLVDKAYQGLEGKMHKFEVQVTSKKPEQEGFVPIFKRWVVERSLGWLEKCRRLWKNCERFLESSLAMMQLAFISLLLRRC